LNPIEVKGQFLFDSVTGKPFYARGIGMPNLKEDIDEWVAVLKRIRKESSIANVVRLYELPNCFADKPSCMKPFMEAADDLGFYVLVPGTGTMWGYIPRKCKGHETGTETCCTTSDDCYSKGGVLGWGQNIVQAFNYPNTLAVVIGNELEQQTPEFVPVIRAYARDMKKYEEWKCMGLIEGQR
jgi:hypothetical protein